MTQTVLTVVGYAVGYYFGGPVGGQIGAGIGSAVGGAIAAPDVQGPRIADTAVQQSSYGAGIAKTWGSDRVAGSLIWADAMREVSNEQSGKGGPTITTYSYTRSFAILIGEGPIGGIRRIWADTKLVLDYRDGSDNDAQAASLLFAQYLTFYEGTEDQMPDATIEAVEGVGNVEPYRGRSYAVLTDLPLGDYGNRIPFFTFEIANQPTEVEGDQVLDPLFVYPWIPNGGRPAHTVGLTSYSNSGTSGTFASPLFQTTADWNAAQSQSDNAFFYSSQAGYSTVYTSIYTTSSDDTYNIEGGGSLVDSPQFIYYLTAVEDGPFLSRVEIGNTFAGSLLVPEGDGAGSKTFFNYGLTNHGEAVGYRVEYPTGPAPTPATGYAINYASGPIGGGESSILYGNPVLRVRGERVPTHKDRRCYPGDPMSSEDGLAEMDGAPEWCIDVNGELSPNYVWEIIVGPAKQLAAITYRDDVLYQQALGPVLLEGDPNYSNAAFWNAEYEAAVAAGFMHADVAYPATVSTYARGTRPSGFEVDAGSADLADIVRDICNDSGLPDEHIDVSQLEGQTVLGYTRGRRTSARSTIEPLRAAYFFDAVESGDVVRFVNRGAAPVATLMADELSAGVDDSTEELIVSDRGQESELPRQVAIAYKSQAADYQTGAQQSRRRVGGSDQQAGTELAIVLTDDHAAQIAEVLLYDSWVARNKRTFSVGRRWTALEPTDIVTVDDGQFSHRLRVIDKSEQNGVIELQARDDDGSIYTSAAIGGIVSGGGKTIRLDGPTRYDLLDIPMLRDEDDNAAFYVAASGYRPEWRGGRLYRSTNGGSSYDSYQELSRVAVMGVTSGVLGDFDGGNVVDELNAVDVSINAGELASITRADLLNNGNGALVGNEVIQFQRATLTGERSYRLTGLLRGRLGTEQHMGVHEDGDRFVLLSATTLYRPEFALSLVGQELLYKGVSMGGSLSAATGRAFTNTAVALRPLSPVLLAVAPLVGGGYQAQWVRRTRKQAAWLDGVDVPLGETSERYLVRVLDGDTVIESQEVTEPEATLGQGVATIEQLLTLGSTIMGSTERSGELFGVTHPGDEYLADYAVRIAADGTLLEQSPTLGDLVYQVAHGTTAMYVSVSALLPNSVPSDSYLHRIAYSDFTTIATTRTLTAGDSRGVAFDGTDLWVIKGTTGDLLRCNPTTLATVDTYAVASPGINGLYFVWVGAGHVWVGANAAAEIVKIDPATGAEVDRYSGDAVSDLIFVGSLVYVIRSDAVEVRTASTWLLHNTIAATLAATYSQRSAAIVGDLLVVTSYPDIVLIRAATGEQIGAGPADVPAPVGGVAGPFGDDVVLNCYSGLGATMTSRVFDLGAISEAADYGGMTLEVAQLSDLGAGFTATTTIPEAP